MKINLANKLAPAQIIAGGFLLTIFIGAVLLSLPVASREGSLPFLDALFTATSAVCVTGLVVVDTGTYFTTFGQVIIMLLIQIGGLGIMTMTTTVFLLLGKKITLKERLIIQQALNEFSLSGLLNLTIRILKLTFFIELVGAILLSFRFIPQFGWSEGILRSVFHSISAFCNAGFDLMGNFTSLTAYVNDPWVSMVISSLFILGGLGFVVILEAYKKKLKFKKYSLHTKIVLFFSIGLLVYGTIFVFLLEYNNPDTLGQLTLSSKLLASFFTSATTRTAGFNVLPTDLLTTTTLFVVIGLMFVGASPASTGGGIKTTTFGTIFFSVYSLIKGDEEITFFQRRLSQRTVLKSISIVFISILLIFMITVVLTFTEDTNFINVLFEVMSAFGTVGLSTGITPELTNAGRIMIIITMFFGRVGPLTLMLAFASRLKKSKARYPEENIMIG